jgi:hypothetical protein
MNLLVLLSTAAAMGLLGGLHCIAMCSALQHTAVHGTTPIQWAQGPRLRQSPQRMFHLARISGYVVLGAAAGSGSAALRWGAEALPLMRPIWTLLNAALLILGLTLAITGRQPAWLDGLGQRVWQSTGARRRTRPTLAPIAAGLAWALLPCGLLYSALAVAVLASDPLLGAATMFVFGLGTALNLTAARALMQTLIRRSSLRAQQLQAHGARVGGVLLALMAMAALAAVALGQPHPFC